MTSAATTNTVSAWSMRDARRAVSLAFIGAASGTRSRAYVGRSHLKHTRTGIPRNGAIRRSTTRKCRLTTPANSLGVQRWRWKRSPPHSIRRRGPIEPAVPDDAFYLQDQRIVRDRDHSDTRWPQQPSHRSEHRVGIDDVLEHLGADDPVEARRRKSSLSTSPLTNWTS